MGSLADIELHRKERAHISNPPATMAGVYLCRHFCTNPVVAHFVASLAGLGLDRKAA